MPERGQRAAGVIPVRATPSGWRVLVLRCYRNWDFPKGRIEPNEDPVAAARREAREEADLDDLVFAWGEDAWRETAPYARGKVARYYLARTAREDVVLPINPDLGQPEHHEGRWVDLDEAARLLPARLQPILTWAREVLSPE
ncbi:MAG: NUDIX domain-containing protein [Planctomycetota bacterium]